MKHQQQAYSTSGLVPINYWHVGLCIILAAAAIVGAVWFTPRQHVFVNTPDGYRIALPDKWASIPRTGGTQFADSNGTTRLEVLTYRDSEMNSGYLFSDLLASRLRESYHEAYGTDEATIGIATRQIAGQPGRCITYHPFL